MTKRTEYGAHGKSDLTLVHGSNMHYVHQDTVCSQSPVLKKQCAPLHESRAATQRSRQTKLTKTLIFWRDRGQKNIEIDLSGHGNKAVNAMIHFFYHADYYPDSYETDRERFDRDDHFHLAVLKAAMTFEVKALETVAAGLLAKAKDSLAADRIGGRERSP